MRELGDVGHKKNNQEKFTFQKWIIKFVKIVKITLFFSTRVWPCIEEAIKNLQNVVVSWDGCHFWIFHLHWLMLLYVIKRTWKAFHLSKALFAIHLHSYSDMSNMAGIVQCSTKMSLTLFFFFFYVSD